MRVLWLPDVLRGAGLRVALVSGWETRGRELTAVQGVIAHHTAGPATGNAPSLGIVTNGRSDLPGPLSQMVLGRDGTFYVVASGRANHSGAGNWQGITDGNGRMLGIEAEATGTASWPEVQMDAYRRGVAAILRHIGRGADWVCGHKEYALPRGRKPDPNFDMNRFRSNVAAILGGAPPPPPTAEARVLREGMSGQDVAEWQRLLVRAGYPVSADGAFGPKTTAATKQVQSRVGANPDGVVGPDTRARVNQLVNPPAPSPPPKETELFKPRTGDVVVISPEHSGLVLDLPDLGKSSDLVATYKLDGGGDQRWEILKHQPYAPPTEEVSFITQGANGEQLVLDVNDKDNAGRPGQQVAVWDAHFGGQQRFRIEQLETGNNKIVHVGSGLCLEVRDSGGMSAALQLAEWKGTPNQRFRFVGTV